MSELESLWGEEFNVPATKKQTKEVIEKVKKPKEVKVVKEKQIKSSKVSLQEKLAIITEEVFRVLGKQKDNILCIKDLSGLQDYITAAINNGIIAIDTETSNSTDPITCKLMGPCIYTPGQKWAYIPINHRDPETKERLDWQLTESDIKTEFQRLLDANTFTVTQNGKFDIEVIKCTCGITIRNDWDTLIGSKLLDENENDAGLKGQYTSKIDPEQEKYSIDHLFEGVEYADVDPEIFAYYAAADPYMTYRLYEWQMERFKDPSLTKVLKLAQRVEMPLTSTLADLELAGMCCDAEYADRLHIKYTAILGQIDEIINQGLEELKPQIAAWRLTPEAMYQPPKKDGTPGKSKSEQLEDPINVTSPTQLAILLYDILKAPIVDKKAPRGTGEEQLEAIYDKLKLPLIKSLIERRGVVKLLTTYIETIPELAKRWPENRVHAHFNQYGAQTGRLSSGGKISFGLKDSESGINFQNIPSHSKEIRALFCAKPGYKILGADYSAQEPRITAFMSQDPAMIQAYRDKKDLYSVIASMSFNRKYEDCLEFYPEGTVIEIDGKQVTCGYKTHTNVEGKKYRTSAKAVLLGITYGRGAASVGEQIGKTKEEAQEIINKFFNAFPSVRKWIDQSIADAHEKGYVEDVAGRRRRLPDAQLPKYDIKLKDGISGTGAFNPFLGCSDRVDEKSNKLLAKYKERCDNIKYARDYDRLKNEADLDGVEIHSNTGFIAQAERQAVNARIQGSAATLTKCALNKIHSDERLKELGAYLVNTVHDEILIEAPECNAELAGKYLVEDMLESAKEWVDVPMAADLYIVSHWYEDEACAAIQKEYQDNIKKKGMSESEAEQAVISNHTELTAEQVLNGLHHDNIFM